MAENCSEHLSVAMTAWDPMPSYWKVANDMVLTFGALWGKYQNSSYRFPRDIVDDLPLLWKFTGTDFLLVTSIAIGFTLTRSFLTKHLFKPLSIQLKLTESNTEKMPESIWKFLYYTFTWNYAFNVIIWSGNYQIFQKPSTVWDDWSPTMPIPDDIYWLYIIQLAFYIHGLYALFFQDAWRKDSVIMGCHHVVTIFLVSFSFACRYHNIGALVMFFCDVCDIQLEFGKINVYLKVRNGEKYKLNDTLAGVSFVVMLVTWFVTRLYYLPLKVLFASSTIFYERNFLPEYTLLMNSMLLLLTAMNVFWFSQMINLLYKIVITGEIDEVDDIREYDVVENIERTSIERVPDEKKIQ